MFRLLTLAIFRLFMNPQKVVIQDLILAVYSGDVADEVFTRSRSVILPYYHNMTRTRSRAHPIPQIPTVSCITTF